MKVLEKIKKFIKRTICKHDYIPMFDLNGKFIFKKGKIKYFCSQCYKEKYISSKNANQIIELQDSFNFGNAVLSQMEYPYIKKDPLKMFQNVIQQTLQQKIAQVQETTQNYLAITNQNKNLFEPETEKQWLNETNNIQENNEQIIKD